MSQLRHSKFSAVIICGVFALMFGVFFMAMPMYVDDLWYGMRQNLYMQGLSDTFPWQGIADTWREHFAYDNARLCNVLAPLALLLPKWVTGLISALLLWYTAVKSLSLAGCLDRRWTYAVWLVFLLSFCLPWYEALGAVTYQLGYVWSAAIFIWCAGRLTGNRGRSVTGCFLAGLLLGSWHEGFAVPLLCMFIPLALRRFRKHFTVAKGALAAGCLIGLIYLLLAAPALDRALSPDRLFSSSHIATVLFAHPAFMAMVVFMAVTLLRPHLRAKVFDFVTLCLICGATAGFLIHFFSPPPPRAGWCCELLSAIVLIRMVRLAAENGKTEKVRVWRHRVSVSVSVAVGLLTAAHLLAVDIATLRLARQFPAILREVKASDDHVVFSDITTEFDAPLINFLCPDYTFYLAPANRFYLSHFYDLYPKGFTVIPAALGASGPELGTEVAGGSGIRQADGHLFAPADLFPGLNLPCGETTCDIDFGLRTRRGVRLLYFAYTSPVDGRRYLYFYPWRTVPDCILGRIQAIYI